MRQESPEDHAAPATEMSEKARHLLSVAPATNPQSNCQDPARHSSRATTATTPRLCITIDTEEEGLWSGQYRMTGNSVENIQGLPRFQSLCDRLGIRPTYLIDAPVVQDDRASDILAEIHSAARCEIGAHVHPWCNPPLDELYDSRESFFCNLPVGLQRAKLDWLTNAISDRFRERPISFRAGRYGLDVIGARILAELGYRVDSSVIPFTDYSSDGGPDFTRAPWQPYFVGDSSLQTPEGTGTLLEVPVSVGFNWQNFPRAMACLHQLRRPSLRWTRIEGVLDEMRLLKRIKLSPEGTGGRDLRTLVDRYCATPGSSLVMMFHSTSLVPGNSPYVRNQQELEQFLSRIVATCEYCIDQHGATAVTLGEMAAN